MNKFSPFHPLSLRTNPISLIVMNASPPLGYHLHLSRPTVNKSAPLLTRLKIPPYRSPWNGYFVSNASFRGQHVENSNARGSGRSTARLGCSKQCPSPQTLVLTRWNASSWWPG